MKIIQYEEKYRDDLIFMVLQAKDALGRVPSINDDLLSIKETYFDKGDIFWVAVDDDDRVIGSAGYSSIPDTNNVWLHRVYVKASLKRQGIGSKLLLSMENHLNKCGKSEAYVHLGAMPYYFESRDFYKKHGYSFTDENHMKKELQRK